jgi:hypothetical protein
MQAHLLEWLHRQLATPNHTQHKTHTRNIRNAHAQSAVHALYECAMHRMTAGNTHRTNVHALYAAAPCTAKLLLLLHSNPKLTAAAAA